MWLIHKKELIKCIKARDGNLSQTSQEVSRESVDTSSCIVHAKLVDATILEYAIIAFLSFVQPIFIEKDTLHKRLIRRIIFWREELGYNGWKGLDVMPLLLNFLSHFRTIWRTHYYTWQIKSRKIHNCLTHRKRVWSSFLQRRNYVKLF